MTRGIVVTLTALTMIGGCTETPPPAAARPAAGASSAQAPSPQAPVGMDAPRRRTVRDALLQHLTPVTLSNCEFTRVGSKNDGGYVMCGNLMSQGKTDYSYGIGGHDDWGCSVSKTLKVPVHPYDCFEPP